MYRKYYPHLAELSEDEVAKQAPFGAKWRLLAQVEVRCYILISNISGSVKVAPLQILQFPVILPHKFQDAEKFNLQFSDFSKITETADKLRWLRYQKGLRQRDVADYAGIYRSTYIHYEEYGKDFYSPKHMEKIAQLFEVPVERLLDDYNLFLRNGQGKVGYIYISIDSCRGTVGDMDCLVIDSPEELLDKLLYEMAVDIMEEGGHDLNPVEASALERAEVARRLNVYLEQLPEYQDRISFVFERK